MFEIQFISLVFTASLAGGLASALLGWAGTQEPFIARKFLASLVKSFIGSALIAAAFDYAQTQSPVLLLGAFLSGAGIDAGLKRLVNAVSPGE